MSKHRATIIIEGVDTKKLERQRKRLHRVIHAFQCGQPIKERNIDALEGLVNMLDHWSDEEYYRRKGKRPNGPHLFAVEVHGGNREQAEHALLQRLGYDVTHKFELK